MVAVIVDVNFVVVIIVVDVQVLVVVIAVDVQVVVVVIAVVVVVVVVVDITVVDVVVASARSWGVGVRRLYAIYFVPTKFFLFMPLASTNIPHSISDE